MSQPNNDLFDALANEHRRRILFDLVDESRRGESPVAIDVSPGAGASRAAAGIELVHVHLPKLDDYGLIDWTPGTDTVETGPRFSDVRPILEQLSDHQAVVTFGSD
ncbi:DUF7344 domain-containing protein [Natrinema salsiterrestre]|uniref:DUF7344 domain-containing protein n=1 Tax=Natrinema salsiterrestre TaxID=2950540 RepID=A0A9Q4Q0X3_9EURY|nr:hypothetical protein [Natrinema salsiterrestre]MDF9744826.1 hypothetical protein [Natrinema salsiterrestre]